MRRGVRSVQLLACALAISTGACGGCGGGGGNQPPPPQPDFALGLSASTVTISQGSTSSPVNVSITAENGFSAEVQVSFTGLPAGVATNPVAPFSVAAGQSVSVLFGAASNAAPGQFNVTAQGTSGALTHSAALSLAIQAVNNANLPLTTYVENDSVALLDNPASEPRRRHIVYDSGNQRFYVANEAMNRVEVYAAASPALQATIDAAGASSVDLSVDRKTVWVGTSLEQILAVDTGSLQVKAHYPVAGITPIPGAVFLRPTEVLALASGKLLVRLRQANVSEALLAAWDPTSNTFTDLTSLAPSVFQNGVGVLARSGDHTRVLAAANDASGELAVFDANGNLLSGPQAPLAGAISAAAADADGSRFAVAITANSAAQVLLLDSNLNLLGSYATSGANGLVFSQDGQSLFVDEAYGNASVVSVLAVVSLQKTGQIPDFAIQGLPTRIEEAGGSTFVCGLGNRGVSFLDVSQPGSLPNVTPVFASAPAAQPSEGPVAGGTSVTLSGANFSTNAQLRFGALNPISATAVNGSRLQAVSPASTANGPVNLTAYFSNGWMAVAPGAFSYGPSIVRVLPNAGVPAGGDTVTVLGYGFGGSLGNASVKVGGQNAAIVSVDALPAFSSTLGLDNTFPFPLERIRFTTPSGTPGKADLSIASGAGSVTAIKAFQYLSSSQTYGNAGLHKFMVYDESRQRVFLSATDHVDVFDLKTQAFVQPIEPPPNGPPPSAGLRGLALTPDHSQLVIADFGSQNVYLVNPDGGSNNGTSVHVGGVAGYLNSGPSRVTATSAQTVFVGLSGEGGSTGACDNCLGQMNLLASPPSFEPAPQPEVASLTGAPLLQADAAGDTAYLAYDTAPGGPVAVWNAAAPNSFALSTANEAATDLTTSGDGTLFAMRAHNTTEIRAPDLTLVSTPATAEVENVPGRVAVPGVALHPSGALIYEPFLDGPPPAAPPASGIRGGIDIRDAHSGKLRLRIYLPEPFAMLNTDIDGLHGGFLAVDENGQRLFALTTSGLTVVQLPSVPLGIGTLTRSSGTAAGGVSVTLRGSGFVNGIKATLGGESAAVTWKDMNTLTLTTPATSAGPQQLVLTNPDGESVSLDAAFTAQ
ncbi:MAG TPA: IPT/TIG domain-containing protein [Candidatus Limnocylindrales bacterium]|nr:IPT/TIG domain-containing protein [Candidatus Limnocylindrales bacterium]